MGKDGPSGRQIALRVRQVRADDLCRCAVAAHFGKYPIQLLLQTVRVIFGKGRAESHGQ